MSCESLVTAWREAPLAGWECTTRNGLVHLTSPMRYADGGLVELFIELRGSTYVVSDQGEAFRFLYTYGIEPLRSATRARIVEIAARLADVRLTDGVLETQVGSAIEVLPAAIRLGQAVTRIGDLCLLGKGALLSTFADTVEEYLREATRSVELTRNAEVAGHAASHRFDILARSQRGLSVIEALSATTAVGANAQAVYSIAKFADLEKLGRAAPNRFAVLDSDSEAWSESLRGQLSNFAIVVDWEQRERLAASISA